MPFGPTTHKPSAPRYVHDCEDCKFLGQIGVDDAYFCPREHSIVLRDGDDGPEYASFPTGIVEHIIHQPGTNNARWVIAKQMADELLVSMAT